MKLLADECLEPEVVQLLRQSGHDVLWMGDGGSGTLDPDVANLAKLQDRIVLTYDLEFASEIRLSKRAHPGFVVARLVGHPKPEIVRQFEQVLLMRTDWNDTIAVIKPRGVRLHP